MAGPALCSAGGGGARDSSTAPIACTAAPALTPWRTPSPSSLPSAPVRSLANPSFWERKPHFSHFPKEILVGGRNPCSEVRPLRFPALAPELRDQVRTREVGRCRGNCPNQEDTRALRLTSGACNPPGTVPSRAVPQEGRKSREVLINFSAESRGTCLASPQDGTLQGTSIDPESLPGRC